MKKIFTFFVSLLIALTLQAQESLTVTTDNVAQIKANSQCTSLTIIGPIDARDFLTIRDQMPLLTTIDLTSAIIKSYKGSDGSGGTGDLTYPANGIPGNAFCDKPNLKTIILPPTLTSIGDAAFLNCTNLTLINIPTGVINIGAFAFTSCTSLTSLNLPNGITMLKTQVFYGCSNLSAIIIPETIRYIETGAFSECRKLESITIPSVIKSIGDNAFKNCTNLKSVTIQVATPLTITTDVFKGVVKSSCNLYVPQNSSSAYKAVSQWSNPFNQILEYASTSLENNCVFSLLSIIDNTIVFNGAPIGKQYTLFNINGNVVNQGIICSESMSLTLPSRGIYIVKIENKSFKIIY